MNRHRTGTIQEIVERDYELLRQTVDTIGPLKQEKKWPSWTLERREIAKATAKTSWTPERKAAAKATWTPERRTAMRQIKIAHYDRIGRKPKKLRALKRRPLLMKNLAKKRAEQKEYNAQLKIEWLKTHPPERTV